jgi:hypothetical protein
VDAAPGAYQGLIEGKILLFFRFYDLDPVTLADRRSACLPRYFVSCLLHVQFDHLSSLRTIYLHAQVFTTTAWSSIACPWSCG